MAVAYFAVQIQIQIQIQIQMYHCGYTVTQVYCRFSLVLHNVPDSSTAGSHALVQYTVQDSSSSGSQ